MNLKGEHRNISSNSRDFAGKQMQKLHELIRVKKDKKQEDQLKILLVPDGEKVEFVRLDNKTVNFIEKGFHVKINPYIKDQESYYRNIWYLKCCGEHKRDYFSTTDFPLKDCFRDKEKADALFEVLYDHAMDMQFLKILSVQMIWKK